MKTHILTDLARDYLQHLNRLGPPSEDIIPDTHDDVWQSIQARLQTLRIYGVERIRAGCDDEAQVILAGVNRAWEDYQRTTQGLLIMRAPSGPPS